MLRATGSQCRFASSLGYSLISILRRLAQGEGHDRVGRGHGVPPARSLGGDKILAEEGWLVISSAMNFAVHRKKAMTVP